MYREIKKPVEKITMNSCKSYIVLSLSYEHHYDSVYPKQHIINAAVCQCKLSILFCVIFPAFSSIFPKIYTKFHQILDKFFSKFYLWSFENLDKKIEILYMWDFATVVWTTDS